MMSGDRADRAYTPRLGRLTREQSLGLCALSQSEGNGILDLTSRANLQMRGVQQEQHEQVLSALFDLGLLDPTAEEETRRNIVVTPSWDAGDLTTRLHDALLRALPEMPILPAKMGFAIDTGPTPLLSDTSADFRFEYATDGTLILRADGAAKGKQITEVDAPAALITLANWFVASDGRTAGRMSKHLKTTPLPREWAQQTPAPMGPHMSPGTKDQGDVYGAPFGSMDAGALAELIEDSRATALRVTPWRVFLLENAQPLQRPWFHHQCRRPIAVHACLPGRTRLRVSHSRHPEPCPRPRKTRSPRLGLCQGMRAPPALPKPRWLAVTARMIL